jgi:nitroreductase
MAAPELTPHALLTTTRTVRKRLDLARPVERGVVEVCLRVAFQAPNGSNLQLADWVLVDDAEVRAEMAAIYRRGLQDEVARPKERVSERASYPTSPAQERIASSVMHLVDHLHEVPVLVVPTVQGRFEGVSVFDQASRWASVLPAVWSFMLALRLHGLGSAWTTLHLHREREMADLLGIPFDDATQAGLFPVAYTLGTEFRPADRSRSESTIHWDRW